MTLPNFLIIGAMKSGTTSLYADLYNHPEIFLPSNKEPEGLRWISTKKGIRRYENIFTHAGRARAVGEASTYYSKLPKSEGLADFARMVLGPNVNIFYIVRNPIERMISQYHHQVGYGVERRTLNIALREDPDYVNFSRYAWQIAPWEHAFGRDRVHVISFEHYIADRITHLYHICKILNIDPTALCFDEKIIYNASVGKRFDRGLWRGVIGSQFYRNHVRWRFSQEFRDRLKVLLPKAPKHSTEQLSPESTAAILGRLTEADLSLWSNASKNFFDII